MEQYKIENLERDFIKLQFETLADQQSSKVLEHLFQEFSLNNGNLYRQMSDKLTTVCNIPALNKSNGFNDMLKTLDISFLDNEKFYLIWNEQQNIDMFSVSDLKKFWDYIWYGPADEALILYIPEKIVLMIHDWGEVLVKRKL